MHLAESIRIALRSLWAHKLRSVLTLLGVVIGIASVIAVVTFVSGINDYVAKKIFNLGADVFIVQKTSAVVTNVDHFLEEEKRKNLIMEDYQAVQALPSFTLFPYFFIIPGLLVAVAAALVLGTDSTTTRAREYERVRRELGLMGSAVTPKTRV